MKDNIFTAPVMIPDTPDCAYMRGETPLTKEQIKKFHDDFDHYGIIDMEHEWSNEKYNKRAEVIKSWLLPEKTSFIGLDGKTKTYPDGTWMLSSKITDPEALHLARVGGINGYSSSTVNRDLAEKRFKIYKGEGYEANKSLIKDVVDPVTYVVSLVEEPCVKSEFCNLNNNIADKSKGSETMEENTQPNQTEMEEKTFFNKIKAIFDGSLKEYFDKTSTNSTNESINPPQSKENKKTETPNINEGVETSSEPSNLKQEPVPISKTETQTNTPNAWSTERTQSDRTLPQIEERFAKQDEKIDKLLEMVIKIQKSIGTSNEPEANKSKNCKCTSKNKTQSIDGNGIEINKSEEETEKIKEKNPEKEEVPINSNDSSSNTDEDDEEKEEDEEEEENENQEESSETTKNKKLEANKSKQIDIQDGFNNNTPIYKSDTQFIYSVMGRNSKGTRVKE